MAKTLIFGGAFDPPHREHVAICKAAVRELGADRLVIVPTYQPPHKSAGFLSFEERCSLARIAFDGIGVETVIDGIEKVRGADNCAYKVLPILKERYGDIVYLIGGDSAEHFGTWKKPEDVAKVCPIAVAAREGFKDMGICLDDLAGRYGGEFILLDCKGKEISSSLIKASLLLGETVEELPAGVMQQISENYLFEEYRPWVEKLKGYQSAELFEHSKAVVKCAVKLNARHNLKQDFDRVFTAALLHDNAKQRPSLDGLAVPNDCIGTPVLHQFLGAEKARRDFGVEDSAVLDAIRCHTTAKPNMTLLEKLIYTADSLSFDRDYEPIPKLRAIAMDSFEKGFVSTLAFTYEKLLSKGGAIYPLTALAYKFYIKNKNI